MKPLLLVLLVLLNGCSIHLGGTTTEQRTHRVIDDGTFVQDGIRWNCVVNKTDIQTYSWRKTREALCYEVKP